MECIGRMLATDRRGAIMTAIDARTGACQAMRRIGDDAAADVAEADREEETRGGATSVENWAH